MVDTVKFDPGMGPLVVDFNEFVNNVYSQLMSFRTIHQKRSRFKIYSSKIEKYMSNNIAFYFGCLLWAYYLVNNNLSVPKEIVGNVFLNMSDEDKENYDYLIQVNFMENYFDSFERDFQYYTGQKKQIPQNWKKILELYSEFLTLNNGFINTKLTSDIVLPVSFKNLDIKIDIKALIDKAIKDNSLESLLELDILS
ncbi:MAG: hypothetical protein E7Z90_04885 [Cyanobacteria bacterium SIG29]|nr:hypothetical protein [Cyanobacteria bacterium SIG29]